MTDNESSSHSPPLIDKSFPLNPLPIPSQNGHTPSPTSSSSSEPPPNYSEISSNQRYIRFNELISQDGTIKYSFKAFDTKNGTEIVWQKIILSDLSEDEQRNITESANCLRAVRHQHILMYFDIWQTDKPKTLNLITSYLDTLRQFVNKVGPLRWRIIKKWCKQILQAIAYLHNSTPQIIHRNLTWRNIFVNPGVGDLYVGGMWLAAIIVNGPEVPISVSDALSSQYIGSPPYRAPEMKESAELTTKMDIYSFGMCVLAMVTGAEPYCECDEREIEQRAASGDLPLGLRRIENPLCVEFIESCLRLNPQERLSVEQLCDHPFLQPSEESDDKVVTLGPQTPRDEPRASQDLALSQQRDGVAPSPVNDPQPNPLLTSREDDAILRSPPEPITAEPPKDFTSPSQPPNLASPSESPASRLVVPPPSEVPASLSPNASSVHVRVSAVPKRGVVTVELRLGEGVTADGVIKDVEFQFNIEQDNYEVVAAEMKQELNLTIPTDQLALLIQHHVDAVLHTNGPNPIPTPHAPALVAPPLAALPAVALLQLEAADILPSPTNPHAEPTDTPRTAPPPPPLPPLALSPTPLPIPDPAPPSSQHEQQLEALSPRLDLSSKSDDLSHVVPIHSQGHSQSQGASEDNSQNHSQGLSKSPDDPSLAAGVGAGADSGSLLDIPKPDSDASHEELSDFAELLRELEKIEKECRAARRVFEQRIQKHKIIQDSCEEDLRKIEADYSAQCQQIEKSESKAAQKKEETVQLAKSEFDSRLQRLRESHSHRQQRQHQQSGGAGTATGEPILFDSPSLASVYFNATSSGIVSSSAPERTSTPALGSSGMSSSTVRAKS